MKTEVYRKLKVDLDRCADSLVTFFDSLKDSLICPRFHFSMLLGTNVESFFMVNVERHDPFETDLFRVHVSGLDLDVGYWWNPSIGVLYEDETFDVIMDGMSDEAMRCVLQSIAKAKEAK